MIENAYIDGIELPTNDQPMMIKLDDDFAKKLGFTSDKFHGYLFKIKNDIYISMIVSLHMGKGNVSKLFNRVLELGYNLKVPLPILDMVDIVKKKGFEKTIEKHDMSGEEVDVWVKYADKVNR